MSVTVVRLKSTHCFAARHVEMSGLLQIDGVFEERTLWDLYSSSLLKSGQ